MKRYVTDERMYQAGLLRIVMKMRNESAPFEESIQEVQQKLRLDPDGFRQYIAANLQSAMVAVGKKSR